ncbi:hypothetical protein NDU88_002555 [Pleurodeles waltl]|uniref:Uncharacterized protein n=1 Tax=Pleurodeles waltl TaxID=8319 RepID=A0AAV7W0Z4_PLEWA|nr:hypothetical protein NDU88_002555 [Pleurodeles waltl]
MWSGGVEVAGHQTCRSWGRSMLQEPYWSRCGRRGEETRDSRGGEADPVATAGGQCGSDVPSVTSVAGSGQD